MVRSALLVRRLTRNQPSRQLPVSSIVPPQRGGADISLVDKLYGGVDVSTRQFVTGAFDVDSIATALKAKMRCYFRPHHTQGVIVTRFAPRRAIIGAIARAAPRWRGLFGCCRRPSGGEARLDRAMEEVEITTNRLR